MIKFVENFTKPYLSNEVGRLNAPWKLTSLTATKHGLFIGVCNNETRRDSKLFFHNGKTANLLWEGNAETIGQGLEVDNKVVFAGENGNLLIFEYGKVSTGFELQYATTCCIFNGTPYVLNTVNGEVWAYSVSGKAFKMPGDGIAMSACEYNGKLYAAIADGQKASGLSCSNGEFWNLPHCLCVAVYGDLLVYSNKNRLYAIHHGLLQNKYTVGELPCEKIMHLHVWNGKLWVAGANPDTLWAINWLGEIVQVHKFDDKNKEVGGSCFRVRITDYFYGRSENGNTAVVYRVGD